MTRALVRHVPHTIKQHPDSTPRYEASCQRCAWVSVPSAESAVVDDQCLAHAGRSNHRLFTRTVTSFAFVVREGEESRPPTP
ncbi:hypothetical protein [Streptomyces sp. NPDC101178]|uniref:DUF7848 domain-containing protein n=1 Tax=Streptomyces sp. NPDC101178 TaxID=3366124 RepID=UPI0038235E5E